MTSFIWMITTEIVRVHSYPLATPSLHVFTSTISTSMTTVSPYNTGRRSSWRIGCVVKHSYTTCVLSSENSCLGTVAADIGDARRPAWRSEFKIEFRKLAQPTTLLTRILKSHSIPKRCASRASSCQESGQGFIEVFTAFVDMRDVNNTPVRSATIITVRSCVYNLGENIQQMMKLFLKQMNSKEKGNIKYNIRRCRSGDSQKGTHLHQVLFVGIETLLVCSVAVARCLPCAIPHLTRAVAYYSFVPLGLKLAVQFP